MEIVSPWPGRIAEVHVGPGDHVASEQEVVTIESMKMLMPVTSPRGGDVVAVAVHVDDFVESGAVLVQLSD